MSDKTKQLYTLLLEGDRFNFSAYDEEYLYEDLSVSLLEAHDVGDLTIEGDEIKFSEIYDDDLMCWLGLNHKQFIQQTKDINNEMIELLNELK